MGACILRMRRRRRSSVAVGAVGRRTSRGAGLCAEEMKATLVLLFDVVSFHTTFPSSFAARFRRFYPTYPSSLPPLSLSLL